MKKLLSLMILSVLCVGCSTAEVDNTSDQQLVMDTTEDILIQPVPSARDLEEIKTSNSEKYMGEIYEIKENMFLTQCMDIYMNPDDYIGRTIKLEGMYDYYESEVLEESYQGVIRQAPGCCGDDGVIGFEFLYDGEVPEQNEWIEVIGVVDIIEGEFWDIIVIQAEEVNVLEERGQEFVMF